MYRNFSVAAVIPAFNEAPSIGLVVRELCELVDDDGTPLLDEVVVCDNNSDDDTGAIARAAGARVVDETQPGYGAACLSALEALGSPDVVVFVDGDHSVVAQELPLLLEGLKHADLVIGSRTLGYCEAGALTLPQRLGNRLASGLMRFLWGRPVTDLGPFRAICFQALQRLNMQDRKFGWTVEMQVKAIQLGLDIVEVPVTCTARIGCSKISGTVRGVIGAARGIFTTIFKLWWREKRQQIRHDFIQID